MYRVVVVGGALSGFEWCILTFLCFAPTPQNRNSDTPFCACCMVSIVPWVNDKYGGKMTRLGNAKKGSDSAITNK